MNPLENPPEEIKETQDPPFPTPEISEKNLAALGCGIMRYPAACIAGIKPTTVSVRPSHLFPDLSLRHPFTHVQQGGENDTPRKETTCRCLDEERR